MNKKHKRNSIVKNIIHLFYSTALTSGLNALALIVLAYYLQSHHYGMFSVVLAFAMIMGYFTDAGLSDIVLREGSKKNISIEVVITSYVKLRAGLLIVTFFIGFVVIELSYSSSIELVRLSYFLILPMVTGIAMQSIGTTFFQLIEKMQYYGLIRMVSAACLVTLVTIGMIMSLDPLYVTCLYGASYLIAGMFSMFLVSRHIKLTFKAEFHKGLLHHIWSFTMSGLLFIILPHLGPLVLQRTVTLHEVGLFAVAYRIPQALQQIPFVVAGAYYPVLFRHFNNEQRQEHLNLNITQIKVMAILGMAMTIPFFYMSDVVIILLFGEGWLTAALPLKILSLMLTLQAVNIALADGLTTGGRQNFRTVVQVIAVLTGIGLYFFLSQWYGIIGAAFAGMTIEALALIGFWLLSCHRFALAKRVVVPYMLFFIASFLAVNYLLHFAPILAVTTHYLLLSLCIFLDGELKGKLQQHMLKYRLLIQKKSFKSQEEEHGL